MSMSIGAAISAGAKAAWVAVTSLSFGQAIAVGTVVGVAVYTGYVLIRGTKARFDRYSKKAKKKNKKNRDENTFNATAVEQALENLEDHDPCEYGLKNGHKPKKTGKKKRKTNDLVDRILSQKNHKRGYYDPKAERWTSDGYVQSREQVHALWAEAQAQRQAKETREQRNPHINLAAEDFSALGRDVDRAHAWKPDDNREFSFQELGDNG